MRRVFWLLAAIPILFPSTLLGQDATALLKSMIAATSLDSADAGSWHWKMDVTVYDFNGKNPEVGSIEAWRAGRNMRTLMTLSGGQLTTLRVENELYRSDGDSEKFSPLEAAFMQVLNPIPNNLLDPSVKFKRTKRNAGSRNWTAFRPPSKCRRSPPTLALVLVPNSAPWKTPIVS